MYLKDWIWIVSLFCDTCYYFYREKACFITVVPCPSYSLKAHKTLYRQERFFIFEDSHAIFEWITASLIGPSQTWSPWASPQHQNSCIIIMFRPGWPGLLPFQPALSKRLCWVQHVRCYWCTIRADHRALVRPGLHRVSCFLDQCAVDVIKCFWRSPCR